MSEKRKTILAADLLVDHGDEIKALKDKGATVSKLVDKFGCSRNTMTKVLIKLGFDAPNWTKKN